MIIALLSLLRLATSIIATETIKFGDGDKVKTYMWFGFLAGGTIEKNYTIDADDTVELGFYLCDIDETAKIEDTFEDSDFWDDNYSGYFSGCTFNTTLLYVEDIYEFNITEVDMNYETFLDEKGVDLWNLTDMELWELEEEYINGTDLAPDIYRDPT